MLTKAIPLRRMLLIFLLASLVGMQSLNVLVFAIPTDLNQDGVVDLEDIFIVVDAYGSHPGDPKWNPRADLNDDVSVDMVDVTLVAKEYNQNDSSRLSSFGGHSVNWSSEEERRIYQGLIEPPDGFVSYIWRAPETSALHRKYPDRRILVYRNFKRVEKVRTKQWASQENWRLAEYEFARSNNIILKDSSGNDVYSKTWGRDFLIADIGNPKWQQFIADWIKFYIDNFGFDGVFLDCGLGVKEAATFWTASTRPINPRTGTYFTDEEIVRYYIQAHQKIRNTIGNDKLIICNGIYHGERFFKSTQQQGYLEILKQNTIDGFLSEGLFGDTSFWGEDRWLESVEFIAWLQDNWLSKGKVFVPHVNWYKPKTETSLERVWVGFDDGYSLEHAVTYCFASTLLGIKPGTSESNFFSADGCWYKPFAKKLFSLDLGAPTTDYYRMKDTHVYVRKFEKGLVLVNPTTSTYTISLQTKYRTLEGVALSSLTIRRHQGVILLST